MERAGNKFNTKSGWKNVKSGQMGDSWEGGEKHGPDLWDKFSELKKGDNKEKKIKSKNKLKRKTKHC